MEEIRIEYLLFKLSKPLADYRHLQLQILGSIYEFSGSEQLQMKLNADR
jgi:hypothetical protein